MSGKLAMQYNGWVPLRRGLLEHTQTGRLSTTESMVFVTLVLLADKSTGRGHINAPVLRVYLPDLSRDAAKRALLSLQEKQYIFREIVHRSPLIYPYWVNKYEISSGPHKALQLDLSEVFHSGDIGLRKYLTTALAPAPEGALAPAPEGAHYNDKNIRQMTKTNPSSNGGNDSMNADDVHVEVKTECIAERTREPACALQSKHGSAHGSPPSIAPIGIRWSGNDGSYIDTVTKRPVAQVEVNRRIANVGLLWEEGRFLILRTGEEVNWQHAQEVIAGKEASWIY